MFHKVVGGITRTARLVLDVREWFGTVFGSGPELQVPTPGGGKPEVVRTIVRPDRPLTVTASPTVPRHPGWPFSGPVELVTIRTPAGLLAFFGKVRTPDHGPLRRILLEGTEADLRIEGDGYRTVLLKGVPIADRIDPSVVREVFIYPTGELPDAAIGPTILTGMVTNPNGTGRTGAKVEPDTAGLIPAEVDENGVWVLELDPPGGPRLKAPGEVALTFRDPSGNELHKDPAVKFEPRRLNRYPRTTLFGRVETADARPVRAATVQVDSFPGETTTRPDGTWLFALGVDQPTSGTQRVRIRVTPKGGEMVVFDPPKDVNLGQANEIPVITA